MFDSLLTNSLLRMEDFWCSPIAVLCMTTYGVFINFSKYEWFSPHHSSHRRKSRVGRRHLGNSSGISVVKTKSSFMEFMAGKHSLAILALVPSFSSLSSSSPSTVISNFIVCLLNLIPSSSTVDVCLPSSTNPRRKSTSSPASTRMDKYCSPHDCITSLAAAIVARAPIGPPSACWYDWPPNL